MAACPAKIFMIVPMHEVFAKNALARINFIAVIVGFYFKNIKNHIKIYHYKSVTNISRDIRYGPCIRFVNTKQSCISKREIQIQQE
jgi:hypothetical protein